MYSVLTAVLPIFALILAGYLCRVTGLFGANACPELNRFVVYLALPAMLFGITAKASWQELYQPEFIGAYGIGSGLVFVLTILVSWRQSGHLADAGIDGLNAAYANTGFMGFPLVLMTLGPESLAPTMVATIFTVFGLFAVAIVLIEVGVQKEKNPLRAVRKVSVSLLRNPLVISPILGGCFSATGWPLPQGVHSFFQLLGGAASPCALVALGLFLAGKQAGEAATSHFPLVLLKLIGQPLVTWVLAFHIFSMPTALAHTAVILAALPTGTGPFMLAEVYQRRAGVTSRVIMISTVASVVTLSSYLLLTK